MRKTGLVITMFLLTKMFLVGQELACNIKVNTAQLQGTNKAVFEALEESLNDFMNNRIWTNHIYEATERIECNFLININDDKSAPNYKGTLQVQARRPVFGTTYNTVLLNYVDKDVEFKYEESDAIDFSENAYVSNLTSLLGYYVYLILALDYDSFSPEGGTVFYQKAEKIVTNAQASGKSGWKGGDSRERKNRYWFIDNALDNSYKPIREFSYRYHRLGMDVMSKNIELGRTEVFECVKLLDKFYTDKPDPFMQFMRLVFESKSAEIVQIFSEAPADQKTKVYDALSTIDPAGGSKYDPLKK